jgi:hypothetical protein
MPAKISLARVDSEAAMRFTLILVKICSEQNLRGAIRRSAWSEMA